MKKLLLILGFLGVLLFFSSRATFAACVQTVVGTCIEIPSDATGNTVKTTTCPDGTTCTIYSGVNPDGSSYWVCTNGNHTTYPPPYTLPVDGGSSAFIPPTETPPAIIPACNTPCNTPADCQGVQNGCTACLVDLRGQGKTCQPQAPTATITPVPACNAPCQSPAACQGAQGGCTTCTNGTCQSPPVCGAPCANNPNICNNLVGCNYCNPSTKQCSAQPTATPTPTSFPTPTPTPTSSPTPSPSPTPTATPTPSPTPFPFDNSMCSCDQLKQPIGTPVLGNPFVVTAYGKVLGVNRNYAKIPTFTFTFFQGNGTVVNQLKTEKVNTTVIEDTAEKTRYQAIWTLNLDAALDKSQTYRIQAHPDCSRKAAVAFFNTNRVVLGTASARPQSLWDKISSFFAGIFGGGNSQPSVNQITAPTPTLTVQEKRNLQLKTFTPAQSVETGMDANNCTFIKFHF